MFRQQHSVLNSSLAWQDQNSLAQPSPVLHSTHKIFTAASIEEWKGLEGLVHLTAGAPPFPSILHALSSHKNDRSLVLFLDSWGAQLPKN